MMLRKGLDGSSDSMKAATGGMGLPPGFKL